MPPPTDTEAALLKAILAAPADDLPRLVYADWLDENGQPERAEFVRTEIEMATMMPDRDTAPSARDQPRYRPLERRAGELWNAHYQTWFPGLDKYADEYQTHRGFPYHAAVAARRFVTHSAALFRIAPTIFDVIIDKIGGNAAALAKCEAFAHVERLSFFETPFRTAEAEAFFPCEHLHKLKVLDVAYTDHQIGPDGAESLALCPSLVSLEDLNLNSNAIHDTGAAEILGQRKFRTLREIDFGNNGLSSAVAEDFVVNRHLDQLRILDLSWNHMTATGVNVLCGVPHLARLERLELHNNPLGLAVAVGLTLATFAGSLTKLGLYGCELGDEGLAELFAGRFPKLTDLGVGSNTLGEAAVAALAANDGLAAVESLHLSACGLTAAVASGLARVRTLPALGYLNVGHQPMSAPALTALLSGPLLQSVERLHIERAEVDDAGARAIAAADLPNLRTLYLGNNHITDAGARALVESKGLAGLTYLTLADNPLTETGVAVVKERFGDGRCRV